MRQHHGLRWCPENLLFISGLYALQFKGAFPSIGAVCISNKNQGDVVLDPFRKGIGHAVQWYDFLRRQVLQKVEDALFSAEQVPTIPAKLTSIDCHVVSSSHPSIRTQEQLRNTVPPSPAMSPPSTPPGPRTDIHGVSSSHPSINAQDRNTAPPSSAMSPPSAPPGPRTECARILQRRCPSCFAGVKFGHALES